MWHSPTDEIPPGVVVTIDLGDNFVLALATCSGLESEEFFRWSDVKRWAELPPDAFYWNESGGALSYRIH